jgi:prepilin-type N-terminal cleavage/methylation domain-containing protein
MKDKQSMLFKEPATNKGFTLAEVLSVVGIISILLAIAIPKFLEIINQQRVTLAQDKIIESIKKAQREAMANRSYSASFSIANKVPQVAVYPTISVEQMLASFASNVNANTITLINWKDLSTGMNSHQLFIGTNDPTHTITFDELGTTQNVKFTVIVALADKNGQPIPSTMRCVVVVNTEGEIKTGKSTECGIMQRDNGLVNPFALPVGNTTSSDMSKPFPW